MKRLLVTLLLVALAAGAAPALQRRPAKRTARAARPALVKRGAPVGNAPSVRLSDVLREPQEYAGKAVVVEGVVERACTRKGCWMEIAPRPGAGEGVRVTFKDYGFFVPLDAQGMKARAEGQFTVETLSREKADHYAEEGARVRRNPDGTANEITFVATGVELRR